MDQVLSLIRQFIDLFRFWIIVCPWEQAVRVRFGKRVSILQKGIHLRLPLMDKIFLQSTRMRICSTDRQTVTTKDGKTITLTASIGYSIGDVHALYNTLHHADDTIRHLVRAKIADIIAAHSASELNVAFVASEVAGSLDLKSFGLAGSAVYLNEFSESRTYRLIGDHAASYTVGSNLSTEAENTVPVAK